MPTLQVRQAHKDQPATQDQHLVVPLVLPETPDHKEPPDQPVLPEVTLASLALRDRRGSQAQREILGRKA